MAVFQNYNFSIFLLVIMLCNFASWFGVALLPIYVSDTFGSSNELILSMFVSFVPGLLLSPFISLLLSSKGPGKVLILSFLLKAIIILPVVLIENFAYFQILIFLSGIINPFIDSSIQTLRAYITPEKSAVKVNSMIQGSLRFIKIFAPSVSAILALYFNSSILFIFLAGLYFLSFLFLIPILTNFNNLHFKHNSGRKITIENLNLELKTFKQLVWNNSKFRSVFIPSILYMITLGGMRLFLFWHTKNLGISEKNWSYLLSAQGVGAFLGSIICAIWISKLERKVSIFKLFFIVSFLEGLLLLTLPLSTNLLTSFIIILIASIPEAIAYILYFSISQKVVPKRDQTTLNGLSNPVFDLMYILGLLSGGLYTSNIVSLNLYWIALGLCSTLPPLFFIRSYWKKEITQQPNNNLRTTYDQ